ncbi:MAG: TIGR03560 family F420-dependent LLM class oxidoreductase [Chloroflexi bacterium]|nr:MAG: TIGR03560 family F420-dependent LLM class oxidoreductase [Chloroflexota bacterium]
MASGPLTFGVLLWPQYTDWPSLMRAGARADQLGYDSLWTWDHLYPIVGSPQGPIFEGYLTLAGWASLTRRIGLGLMVGANTFRNPALVVKMVTALDHMSSGRMVLGIGGAWFETEHTALGIDFGASVGERLDRLDEAVALMVGMLHSGEGTARGRFYHARSARNDPPPVQRHLPILIGGGGERKTLATVARYADMWNIDGTPEEVRHKDEVLRRWCESVRRDTSQIERTANGGAPIIRDDLGEARRVAAEIGRRNGNYPGPDLLGPPERVAEHVRPFVGLGFRNFYFDMPAPFDDETLERLIRDVKPLLN